MSISKIFRKLTASPLLILALVCFILGGINMGVMHHAPTTKPQTAKNNQKVLAGHTTPTPSPTVEITNTIRTGVLQYAPTNPTSTSVPQPTDTPVPQPTAIPTNNPVITVQVNEPDGSFDYNISFHSGLNPCSILNEAKNAGSIRSVTITHYGAPLNSDYVKEMNGYSDNWKFSINGTPEPSGCSNYTLNQNDTVSWKYN